MLSRPPRLAALACLIALYGCSTVPPASPLPALLDCPRPSPELLRPVPPLPPIPTSLAGSFKPGIGLKFAASGWTR
jgi:hypothetical protein